MVAAINHPGDNAKDSSRTDESNYGATHTSVVRAWRLMPTALGSDDAGRAIITFVRQHLADSLTYTFTEMADHGMRQ
jgi:hypothetical protein